MTIAVVLYSRQFSRIFFVHAYIQDLVSTLLHRRRLEALIRRARDHQEKAKRKKGNKAKNGKKNSNEEEEEEDENENDDDESGTFDGFEVRLIAVYGTIP